MKDPGVRIPGEPGISPVVANELPERSPLCRSPGICRASPAVQTTFIADTYRMGIEAFCVRPDTFERAGEVQRSVLADVVVVACSVRIRDADAITSKASGESVQSSLVALQCTTKQLIVRIISE